MLKVLIIIDFKVYYMIMLISNKIGIWFLIYSYLYSICFKKLGSIICFKFSNLRKRVYLLF